MLPFIQIKSAIDWTFRDTRSDSQSGGRNRRAKVQFFAAVPILGQQLVTYDVANDLPDGLPQAVSGATWHGLPWDGIDAGLNWGNGKVYFFRGSEYVRYDLALNAVDPGYDPPLSIAGHWPGMPWGSIDAVVNWGNGKVYFFNSTEYARYDIGRDRVDSGYPLPIAGNWPGLPWNSIDAVVAWGNGKAYFFNGTEYIQYDIAGDRVDWPQPQAIATLRIGPSGYSLDDYRASVEAIARSLVGSHYLWGSTGARPGGAEGTLVRPGMVSLETPRTALANPSIFAAQCSADPQRGRQICGGNYDRVTGGGNLASLPAGTESLLQDYLAELETLPPEQWHPLSADPNIYPRRMLEGTNSPIVLGEDCRGKRHFDCVGFVNYCVEMALGRVRPVSFDIAQWANDLSGTVDVPKDAPPQAADILTRDFHHIGFLASNGEVIHAAETKSGVIVGAYNPQSWSRRRRLTSALLHP